MHKKINIDAAQRVIESDSFLMQMFMKTPRNLTMAGRIKEVFKSQIQHDPAQFAEYVRIRTRLNREKKP